MRHRNASIYPILQALVAAVLFGASAPFSKLLLGEIDPIPLAALLYLGSGISAIGMLLIQRLGQKKAIPDARLDKADLPWLAGAMLSGGVAAPILLMWGLNQTPASTASLLLNFEGVATTLIAVYAFKEAVGQRIISAIGLITLASILLSWTGGAWGFSLGALGVIGACFLWGLDNNLTRHISAKNPLVIVGVKGLGAGTFSLALSLLLDKPLPGAGMILPAMLLGALSYGLSIKLFILAMRGLGAARTSTLFGTAPFVGTLLAFFLLRETPALSFLGAVPIMLIGAWLMLSENHHHYHVHELIEHTHEHAHPDEHHQHEHLPSQESSGRTHIHAHAHQPLAHDHPHSPDLHHWHEHAETT